MRLFNHSLFLANKRFQSTHPRGMRPVDFFITETVDVFQSTHPRGMRHRFCRWTVDPDDFNPRIREGCDAELINVQGLINISIHASARDATGSLIKLIESVIISIHASARDATSPVLLLQTPFLFQSTHPRGMRQNYPNQKSRYNRFQSTHPRGMRRHLLFTCLF